MLSSNQKEKKGYNDIEKNKLKQKDNKTDSKRAISRCNLCSLSSTYTKKHIFFYHLRKTDTCQFVIGYSRGCTIDGCSPTEVLFIQKKGLQQNKTEVIISKRPTDQRPNRDIKPGHLQASLLNLPTSQKTYTTLFQPSIPQTIVLL